MGFLLTFSQYVSIVFAIVISIFGISYSSMDDGPIYMITVLGVNAISMGYVFIQELLHHRQARGKPYPYLLLIIVPFVWLAEIVFGQFPITDNAIRMLQNFYAIGASGIVVGTYCYRYDKLHLFIKNLELIALICTIGMILALPSIYAAGSVRASIGGGGNHQTISYTAAINFATFFVFIKNKHLSSKYHYKLFRLKIAPTIAAVLMVVNAVLCIIGGGRGGAVLLVASLIVCLYFFAREKFFQTLFILLVSGLAFYFIATNVTLWGIDEIFKIGFERAFSYLSPDGIDASKTSGRDDVYGIVAHQMIRDVPLFGYGIFHQYDLCWETINQPYSHNLFYEWILQGGPLYLLIWCVVYVVALYKASKLIKNEYAHAYLIAIMGYPCIMLLFSGTYILTPLFWFSIIYVLNYKTLGKVNNYE